MMHLCLKNLFYVVLFVGGCGSERQIEPKAPIPSPTQTPLPGGIQFSQVQGITGTYCLRCHSTSQFLKSEQAWRSSDARARLTARTMPQAGSAESKNLSDADRGLLISF